MFLFKAVTRPIIMINKASRYFYMKVLYYMLLLYNRIRILIWMNKYAGTISALMSEADIIEYMYKKRIYGTRKNSTKNSILYGHKSNADILQSPQLLSDKEDCKETKINSVEIVSNILH